NLIDRIDVYDPIQDDDVPAYVNVGKATTQGVELALGADITDKFWAGLNYTYMRTEDRDLKRELEGRPRHRANLDLRYRFPFGLTTSVQLSYVNRQFFDKEVARRTYEWTRSPDFFLVNARAEQKLLEIWGVEGRVFIEAQNLTDRDYYEVGKPSPGRNFMAGLSFKY
ncbi:MAG TPA: TonB-dependent receptor, partial [Desulfobulbaceae bacterium]|nr:TonB-dependent receptor [Desulfobulbaceae bacterium]